MLELHSSRRNATMEILTTGEHGFMLKNYFQLLRFRISRLINSIFVYLYEEIRFWKNASFSEGLARLETLEEIADYLFKYSPSNDLHKCQAASSRYLLIGELDKAKFYAQEAEALKLLSSRGRAPYAEGHLWVGGDWVSNIGHTALGLDILRAKNIVEDLDIPVYFYTHGHGNNELLKLFAKHLQIIKLGQKDYFDLERVFRNSEINLNFIPLQNDLLEIHHAYKFYNNACFPNKVSLSLTDEQRFIAEKSLQRLGVDITQPLIAFHVRESKEVDQLRAGNQSDLKSIVKALTAFSRLGFQFIRMGHRGMRPLEYYLNEESEKIKKSFFDYANSIEKSEIVDLYLWANCDFFIGGDSGPIMVPPLFLKPTLRVNSNMPFLHNIGYIGYVLPKLVSDRNSLEFNSFETLRMTNGLMHASGSNRKFDRHFLPTEVIIDGISDMISLQNKLIEDKVRINQIKKFDLPISPSFVQTYRDLFNT